MMTKGLSTSVAMINGSVQVELVDIDFGYTARVSVTTNANFSPRLASLVEEEANRALQNMRRHMEACRLPKKKGTR